MSCVTVACVIWYWVGSRFTQRRTGFPPSAPAQNTTGYDLRHLFIGSEGTLGIITAATLKLFAQPQTKATAWVGLDDIESAVSLLTAVQGHFAERLTSFELISRFALDLSSEFSQLKKPADAEWHILIELADSVPDAGLDEKLAEFLYQNGWENSILAQSEQERSDLWTLRENISASQRKLGTSIKHDHRRPYRPSSRFCPPMRACFGNPFPRHTNCLLRTFRRRQPALQYIPAQRIEQRCLPIRRCRQYHCL